MIKKHEQVNANLRAAIGRNHLFRAAPPPPAAPGPTQGNAGSGTANGSGIKPHQLSANAAIRKAAGWTYDPYEES